MEGPAEWGPPGALVMWGADHNLHQEAEEGVLGVSL